MAHSLTSDNGYDKNGKKINDNGGDEIDYIYDENGEIVLSTSVFKGEINPFTGNPDPSGFGYRAVSGRIDFDNTLFDLYAGGKTADIAFSGIKTLSKLRIFKKYIFSSATTNAGGKVYSIFGTIKYVGSRSSTFGTKLGYTKSIKIDWFGKEYHIYDW